ncbi:MBL fold metallo-hydrolase [uncultured Sphingomonas sp.]|uniref:MBL fold metallo-hydrolase n=1 Tax=uncultured Sphingomonas sp. TaxID=158754 RepID=UPI002600C77B|nr:MBL fold metallo-hydrolase [uncultured Sphingomonas sp.]
MRAELIQHPVGQGGFFSGSVTDDQTVVRWVYDCGSNQRDPLLREIRSLGRGTKLDYLFLSHLDSDHISGVDALLAACPVEEVVLPYLLPEMIIAALGRDAATGTLSGLMLDLAADLPGWFTSRGVERITFVGGDDGEGPIDTLPPLEPTGREREGALHCQWQPKPGQSGLRLSVEAQGTAEVRQVQPRAAMHFVGGVTAIDWVLIPHVHTPTATQIADFRKALLAAFVTLDLKKISDEARTPEGRAKLRDCYEAFWRDHNLVSMTLYTGPVTGTHLHAYVARSHGYRYRHHHYFEATGWLLTGDAHLDQRGRRDRMLQRYSPILRHIGVLLLPHHGSAANWHDELLTRLPHVALGLAAAGPNTYGHPHRRVKDALWWHHKQFYRVGTRRKRRVTAVVRRD